MPGFSHDDTPAAADPASGDDAPALEGLEISHPDAPEDKGRIYMMTVMGMDAANSQRGDLVLERETWAFGIWRGADLVAGITGQDRFNWSEISTLWVDAAYRGLGIGRDLVANVEARARELGQEGMEANALSFQAPGFLESCGFEEIGRIPGRAGGAARIYYAKPFTV